MLSTSVSGFWIVLCYDTFGYRCFVKHIATRFNSHSQTANPSPFCSAHGLFLPIDLTDNRSMLCHINQHTFILQQLPHMPQLLHHNSGHRERSSTLNTASHARYFASTLHLEQIQHGPMCDFTHAPLPHSARERSKSFTKTIIFSRVTFGITCIMMVMYAQAKKLT